MKSIAASTKRAKPPTFDSRNSDDVLASAAINAHAAVMISAMTSSLKNFIIVVLLRLMIMPIVKLRPSNARNQSQSGNLRCHIPVHLQL